MGLQPDGPLTGKLYRRPRMSFYKIELGQFLMDDGIATHELEKIPGIFTLFAVLPSNTALSTHRSGLNSLASGPQIAADLLAAPKPTYTEVPFVMRSSLVSTPVLGSRMGKWRGTRQSSIVLKRHA